MNIYSEVISVRVSGKKANCRNITQGVQDIVGKAGIESGIVLVQTLHTTTGLTGEGRFDKRTALMVQEDEPGLIDDIRHVLDSGAKKALEYIEQASSGRNRMMDYLPKKMVVLLLETTLGWLRPKGEYKHDDFEIRTVNIGPDERKNAEAHLKATMLRESIALTIKDGRLKMGQWQSILFWDFDPYKRGKRSVQVLVMGE